MAHAGEVFHGAVNRDLIGVKRDLIGVKRDLIGIKRDLFLVKRDLIGVKRDLIGVKRERKRLCPQCDKAGAVVLEHSAPYLATQVEWGNGKGTINSAHK